jgi:hypothetical protein
MLNELGLQRYLGVATTAELFEGSANRIYTTSALRYPVFKGEKNYSGDAAIVKEPLFVKMLETLLGPNLAAMPRALVIPLGKWAAAGVLHLADRNVLEARRVLLGFPHPSGANGHRKISFEKNAPRMRCQLAAWFSSQRSAIAPRL